MSRSHKDGRRGGSHDRGMIGGLPAIVGDQVRNDFGWEHAWTSRRGSFRQRVKRFSHRMQRRVNKALTRKEVLDD